MWGIHQAAAPAKVGSRLSRELGSQSLLIPTAGAPRGGAQPVRGGRGHVGGTSEQFPTLPRFPHPKPSKKQFKGRKSAPCPGRCRGAGPSQAPAVPSRRPLRDQNPAICCILEIYYSYTISHYIKISFLQIYIKCDLHQK